MKKILAWLTALCLSGSALGACGFDAEHPSPEHPENTGGNPPAVTETEPDQRTYSFASYQDASEALTNPDSGAFPGLRKEQETAGDMYRKTLSGFASGELKMAIPYRNGSPIPLRNRDGYANVSLLTSDLYGLPWLWYHCVAENRDLRVCIAYPQVLESAELNASESYRDVLRLIAPDAPSPDNYRQYTSYQSIYEKQILLQNGQTVTAMISELTDRTDIYVMFSLDGMLIVLYADSALFTDAFFQSFSIQKFKN